MNPTRQALEAFLADHPNDMAAHAAYADWLIENDDSRGEYIREALALQDRTIPEKERVRRARLLVEYAKAHEQEWLGTFQEFVKPQWWPLESRPASGRGGKLGIRVQLGWIVGVYLPPTPPRLWSALLNCPAAKLVRHICINEQQKRNTDDPNEWISHLSQFPALRSLTIGLTGFADLGISRLLASGILAQLTQLRLYHCSITDSAALALAADPHVRKLKHLDLSWNNISESGRTALAKVGCRVGYQCSHHR